MKLFNSNKPKKNQDRQEEDRTNSQQRKIIFQGKVQGVGFRYTVNNFANQYNIFGYVENLDNGDVSLVADGKEENIDKLIMEMKKYRFSDVKNVDQEIVEDKEKFERFTVR